jgi:hypothetical protein
MNKTLNRTLKTMLLAGAAAAAGAAYMVFEAQWLTLSRRRLPLPGLPTSLDGLKLLHVSDLHAGAPGPNSRAIAKFASAAGTLDPDLILFTGDMTDKMRDISPYLELLGQTRARYGKFAVLGNHDHGVRKTLLQDMARRVLGPDRVPPTAFRDDDVPGTVARNRELLAQAGIRLLENECALVPVGADDVQICGIDDFQYGYADMPGTAAQVNPQAALRILLSHSPDAVSQISNGDYNLVLSGHTHGGQICLPHPTRGKILLSTSGSEFGGGLYRLDRLTMHVSRGVGTTLLPFRLLSRPEITLLELSSV